MFYSETLLSKTGPLARVWLAANLERKLSKSNILQSDIESSVSAIVDQGQAPMALRLSGQLLLGVVRIYSRKARYLLDDCNEALIKIKMVFANIYQCHSYIADQETKTFRPGNVDLPANQSHTVNPATLNLPDVLTELDLFAPMPDPTLLLSQPLHPEPTSLNHDLLRTNSTVTLNSIEAPRNDSREMLRLEDDDLELDLGEDPIDPQSERSIEVPRRAATPIASEQGIADEPINFFDDNLQIDVSEDPIPNLASGRKRSSRDEPGEITIGPMDMSDIQAPEEISSFQRPASMGRDEASAQSPTSPLSSIRSSMERDLGLLNGQARRSSLFQPRGDAEMGRHSQKAKKRKILQTDTDTMIQQSQMKAQQSDRSKILKPASFLPKDPALLALMTMQRNGSFVSNILGDGRSQGWAPELRGVLSVEIIRSSGSLKRKRYNGITEIANDSANINDLSGPAQDHTDMGHGNFFANRKSSMNSDTLDDRLSIEDADQPFNNNNLQIPDEDRPLTLEDQQNMESLANNDTVGPLLLSDYESIALGTKHAAQLLRENFGSSLKKLTSRHRKPRIFFHDILPEKRTNRIDATKMFFEVLVLATKDAIKVEQAAATLGGPIGVEEKRGLWGDWAENEVGGKLNGVNIEPCETTASAK